MSPDLPRARQALNRAVVRLYRRSGFTSERQRVEYLFMLDEKMPAPPDVSTLGGSRKRRRR